jgi:hypothetical protein
VSPPISAATVAAGMAPIPTTCRARIAVIEERREGEAIWRATILVDNPMTCREAGRIYARIIRKTLATDNRQVRADRRRKRFKVVA